jgi:hypothetical protein
MFAIAAVTCKMQDHELLCCCQHSYKKDPKDPAEIALFHPPPSFAKQNCNFLPHIGEILFAAASFGDAHKACLPEFWNPKNVIGMQPPVQKVQ